MSSKDLTVFTCWHLNSTHGYEIRFVKYVALASGSRQSRTVASKQHIVKLWGVQLLFSIWRTCQISLQDSISNTRKDRYMRWISILGGVHCSRSNYWWCRICVVYQSMIKFIFVSYLLSNWLLQCWFGDRLCRSNICACCFSGSSSLFVWLRSQRAPSRSRSQTANYYFCWFGSVDSDSVTSTFSASSVRWVLQRC